MNLHQSQLAYLLSSLPDRPVSKDYQAAAKKLLPYIHSQVPPMGEGQSAARLNFLTTVGRHDLSLARLIEGHLDATQILREAQSPVDKQALYAIWASGGPADSLSITQKGSSESGLELTGTKPFCSGSDIADRALIYIYPNEQLVDVDMHADGAEGHIEFDGKAWESPAFSDTHTWSVALKELPITRDNYIGDYKWYFERPGFCLGALGPAACWAGGAMALVDSVRQRTLKDGHAKAHLGAMAALVCGMRSMLQWGAQQIDADPINESGQLFPSALLVRHQIERGCTEILDRFGRTLGPRPYAFERDNARRIAELTLYIRQCHAERDLEELGSYLGEHPEFLSNSV